MSGRGPGSTIASMPTEKLEIRLGDAIDIVEAALQAARESISREICEVPPPIPACDANVNRLLEDRARVADALQTLAKMRAGKVAASRFLQFVESVDGLDAATRARVATLLGASRSV